MSNRYYKPSRRLLKEFYHLKSLKPNFHLCGAYSSEMERNSNFLKIPEIIREETKQEPVPFQD